MRAFHFTQALSILVMTFFVSALLYGLSGCTKREVLFQDRVAQTESPYQVAIGTASPSDCVQGGVLVQTFIDSNGNGVLDSGEEVVQSVPVCHGENGNDGAPGTNGSSAGILVGAAPVLACPSGGTRIVTFTDLNGDGSQQPGETATSESVVCNGINSTITSAPAGVAQCAQGGVVFTTHVDGSQPQVSVVCNGQNGHDGQDARWIMGSLGPSIDGKNFTACHHDYLYIPDDSRRTQGWLIFRHQKNGSEDQGIGQTGFNLWNVDIENFILASESVSGQSQVVYCKVNWDSLRNVLTYEVVEEDFGLAGFREEIVLR